MHGLEKEYGDRIKFIRVNILNPQSAELMEEFSFSATPEFYLVNKEGKIIGFWDDITDADVLRQAFDRALEMKGSDAEPLN